MGKYAASVESIWSYCNVLTCIPEKKNNTLNVVKLVDQ